MEQGKEDAGLYSCCSDAFDLAAAAAIFPPLPSAVSLIAVTSQACATAAPQPRGVQPQLYVCISHCTYSS